MKQRVGVCSWSLQPSSAKDLVAKVRETGITGVQIALDPLRDGSWPVEKAVASLRDAGLEILSGMMGTRGEDYSTLVSIRRTGGLRPDEHWLENLAAARATAKLAERLGLELVTFHAGFIPHDPTDPLHEVMIDRLRAVADTFGAEGVDVGLETGQETAETLLQVLEELDRPRIGVNFDPANMILYGMGDPVAALRRLAPHVRQIHVKDARPTREPGTWGEEVVAGTGAVDWDAFFSVHRTLKPAVDLVIEREAGTTRVADVRAARDLITRHRGGLA